MPNLNGWDNSATAWIEFVEKGDANRNGLLDPVMLDRAGDVTGLDVLDVGCGEGRFARMLAERGAHVVGIDPTPDLIEAGRAKGAAVKYLLGTAERLPVDDASADLVICYLVLIDVNDHRRAIAEMARALRPGGRLLAANLNGFTTANASGWARDSAGSKIHFPVDEYNTSKGNMVEWAGIQVVNWHRPLSAYMQAYLAAGLRLRWFDEPIPTPEAIAQFPNLADQLRVPYFNVMEWVKE